MRLKNYHLRLATPADAEALLKIYAPFVESADRNLSDVSFEYVVPGAAEFAKRICAISAKYPYIVCEYEESLLVTFMRILILRAQRTSGERR